MPVLPISKKIADHNRSCEILYPVHLNPKVREPVNRILSNTDNIKLIEPQGYVEFVYLMAKSYGKEDFIGISGFLFLSGCFPLGLGLYLAGVLTLATALGSVCGLVFVLV